MAAGIGVDFGAIGSASVPIFSTPISRASSSTLTNSASISLPGNRRRNVAIVSDQG